MIINENKINTMSRKELQEALDYLWNKQILSDRELYLYDVIEKRLAEIDKK